MRSIDALAPQETKDTSKEITINESKTTDAIRELNANLKEMTDSTKESIEKITTDFQNVIKNAIENKQTITPTPTPKGEEE